MEYLKGRKEALAGRMISQPVSLQTCWKSCVEFDVFPNVVENNRGIDTMEATRNMIVGSHVNTLLSAVLLFSEN